MIDAAPQTLTDRTPGWWTSRTLQRGALFVLVFVAYAHVWHAGFVWDDDTHLTANPCIVGPLGLKQIWTTASANYFPLVLTTFWVEHLLWGLHPLPYHLVNVAFHALTAIVLVDVLRRLRVRGAWWAVALWALHPVQVESVAWVSELTNAQSGLFFVLTIATYLSLHEKPSPRRFAAVFACAVAALLSKPSTVLLPVVLLLCSWWLERTWSWRRVVALLPLFAFAALVSGWTVWEQRYHSLALGPEWQFGALTRVSIAGRAIWFYLQKLLWPYPLSFVYPRWRVPSSVETLGGAIAVACTWSLLWIQRDRWRGAFFATTYFLLLLFPVLGFFDVYYFRYSFVADHFQYLASIGPVVALAGAATLAYERLRTRDGRGLALAGASGVLALLGATTFMRVPAFADSPTLWRETLAANPTCWIAQTIVGNSEERAGHSADAARHHREAIRLDPYAAEPHYNLGIALLNQNHAEDAVQEFERALQLKANDPDAEHALGVALAAADRPANAIEHYERALELRPRHAPTELMLALALTISNRAEEALPHYTVAVAAEPANFKAQYSFGRTLDILRRYDEAVPHYRAAIAATPSAAAAHGHLGLTLKQLGDKAGAIAELRRAAELEPDNADWATALAETNVK